MLFGGTGALAGEAIDVMVPVALDVAESEHTCQCEVLLHRESRLHRQVFCRQEVAPRRRAVPERTSGRVEQRFVDTLATLARNAGVAERARRRKRVEGRVGLVDQQRLRARKLRYIRFQSQRTRQRLLQVQRRGNQAGERRRRAGLTPEFGDRRHVRELLIAVQRDGVLRQPVEDDGDLGQATQVRIRISTELELEVSVPVDIDYLLECLRQTITGAAARVVRLDRIEHAHRVAGRNSGERPEPAKESAKVEARKVGSERGVDAGRVIANRDVERHTQRATQCIEDRAIDERRTVIGRERVQSQCLASSQQRAVVRRRVAKRRAR